MPAKIYRAIIIRAALLFCGFVAPIGIARAQSATPITYPDTLGKASYVMEAQAVPTSPTVVTTSGLIFGGGWVACNGTGRTITMTDGNGTLILPAVSVTANQTVSLGILIGAYVSGGFSISASGSGCTYSAWWKRRN